MKKKVLPILIGLVLTGCNGLSNEPTVQPAGKVIANGDSYTMMPSNYEWIEDDTEIRQTSPHDVDELAGDFETFNSKKGDTLKFKIDKKPSSIEVTQINEDGTIDNVEIQDDEISLPSKEGYYIYELNVKWDKGKETFVFDVNVN